MMTWRDQRGSTSIVFVLAWSVILLSVAFAADFARIFVFREQLRTAEDAAALAGALQLDYKVRLVFSREKQFEQVICEDEVPEEDTTSCTIEWWEPAADVTVEDWEFAVATEKLWSIWSEQCMGEFRCAPEKEVFRCWIEPFEGLAALENTARSLFQLNQTWGEQATVRSLDVKVMRSDAVAAGRYRTYQVLVDGELEMKTYLLAVFGIDKLPVKTLELKPKPAKAELVRRSDPLMLKVPEREFRSPCDPA